MNLQKLRDKIIEGFNLSEVRDLCFNLNVQYENLEGTTLNDKARELVEYCKRQGSLPELVTHCKELRPRISWQEVAESLEQWPPQLREDKLAFLCWVYIKLDGSTSQYASSDEIASLMNLSQAETKRNAQYLVQHSLLDFSNWYLGIKITHQGILKAESDLLQGFIRESFPQDILVKIKSTQKKRFDFLHSLYKKSKPHDFEPVSGIEIANSIGSDYRQLYSERVLHYLNAEGWLFFRGEPSVQITESGIEKVETEGQNKTL
jgi:hypothetical protein